MGKKLDALLGRSFKTSKFKATVNLAISRLSVLRKQRQARYSVARSDVVELLKYGNHERALLRVDLVIMEQNMLDAYVLIEAYCIVLIERINLIEQEKTFPEELKEVIASLIYAASRCGDFPELQEVRAIFASRYGKEFVARAVELRNNCGVNPKMIPRLSTRMPSLENRLKKLKEIASENNIVLQLEEEFLERAEDKVGTDKEKDQPKPAEQTNSGDFKMGGIKPVTADFGNVEGFSNSMEMRKKYKDVADAALAAFESAAYAAAAARVAVELSRSDSNNPDDPNNPKQELKGTSSTHEPVKSKFQAGEKKDLGGTEDQDGMLFEKIHLMQVYSSESDEERFPTEDKMEKFKEGKNEARFKKSLSTLSSESLDNISNGTKMPLDEDLLMKLQEDIVFIDSDDETRNKNTKILSRTSYLGDSKQMLHGSENPYTMGSKAAEESYMKPYCPSPMHFPVRSQAGLKQGETSENSNSNSTADHLNMKKGSISVRTRRTYG